MQSVELAEQTLFIGPVADTLVLQASPGTSLVVPGDAWLLKADFTPQGSDLLLTGPDGSRVLIRDFFSLDSPPDLMTDAGGVISAELATKLAGPTAPGQFALLENGPFADVGKVLTIVLDPPPPAITSELMASGRKGDQFTYVITASNGPTVYTASPLPDGLTIDGASGLIAGRAPDPATGACAPAENGATAQQSAASARRACRVSII